MAAFAVTLPSWFLVREDGGRMARTSRELKPSAAGDDDALVARLRNGDEAAFREIVDRYGMALLGVARMYVKDRAAAEEVVQETWLAVLQGIDRFEGRSSLKTWIFRILANRAKTRGQRESRTLPFSAVAAADEAASEPSVEPERFFGTDSETPFAWAAPPVGWPEGQVESREALEIIRMAIDSLPDAQREVIRLRDIAGWTAEEVAEALEITDGNQRVLLHRARSVVRSALEDYFNPEVART
jgi:RNA polymerase sigma-70 factor (ECF subfamily)